MQAQTLLGLSCYGAKRFAEAVEHLKIAAKSDPGNTELHQVLAQSCLWAKQYSCALDEFHQILQQNPDSAAAHVFSGEALDGLGRTPEAIAEFQAAAKSFSARSRMCILAWVTCSGNHISTTKLNVSLRANWRSIPAMHKRWPT